MTLTEEQYKTLCATCDSVLVADGATFERIAIPWLHVMREHPVFLRQYEDLFIPKPPLRRLFDYSRRVVVNVALWFRLAWRVVRSSGKLWHGDLPKCASVDVVFVSHPWRFRSWRPRMISTLARCPPTLPGRGSPFSLC